MGRTLDLHNLDLVTPDGLITALDPLSNKEREATIFIEKISPTFVGFTIDLSQVFFNIKSTLAQVGVDGIGKEYELDKKNGCAEVRVVLQAISPLGERMLSLIEKGAVIGKLFAADERRRVRNPIYLSRMFGRSDRWGSPLLTLGGLHGSHDLILEQVEGRLVAYLGLQEGRLEYRESIWGFLPTLAQALIEDMPMRRMLHLHQEWNPNVPRNVKEGELLLARTLPLHMRTVFARVVPELLSPGYCHTNASVLQPDTTASGDIYELFGNSKRELIDIPLEFYTLEPYREYVFFEDRDQLQNCLEKETALFQAFETAPKDEGKRAATFIVKGEQLLNLKEGDWIERAPLLHDFPGYKQTSRQALMVDRYIKQQPAYPFLKSIDDDEITSQGILLTRYFPSPLLKRMLLSNQVQEKLKGIYFQYPSQSADGFFSAEDRALLQDLHTFAIPIFWVDKSSQKILRYVQKPGRDTGLFVPLKKVDTFLKATVFGIYGSNRLTGNFEEELRKLLVGILEMRSQVNHPLLKRDTPLALVTGGGSGAMAVGNRIAKELGILSCANVVDFGQSAIVSIKEQEQNPCIEAKMTYRLDKLVERQAEFNLDFPIFLIGGMGTDFELALEEVRRKVGATPPHPILLFGELSYWKEKISHRFLCNVKTRTIVGSEWVSNCLYAIQTADQGLKVYKDFFSGKLPIGPSGPIYEEGFCTPGKESDQ